MDETKKEDGEHVTEEVEKVTEKLKEVQVSQGKKPRGYVDQGQSANVNFELGASEAKRRHAMVTVGVDVNGEHRFWDTQPVPRLSDRVVEQNAPIDQPKTVEDIRATPYDIPAEGLVWSDVNLSVPDQLKELYNLLYDHYVEDGDNMFRFDYSPEFLLWALTPPHYRLDWHVGVRAESEGNRLVAFISAVPAVVHVYDRLVRVVEINYLCVDRQLRSVHLAPLLIREITRRVNRTDVWQAVFTAGSLIPTPVARARYYHRSLNPKKLVDVGFAGLGRNMTMPRLIRLAKVSDSPQLPGIRAMVEKDAAQVTIKLNKFWKTKALSPSMTEEEVRHWLVPRKNVVQSYVVVRGREITDFISFYSLPSSILKHPVHKTLRAAYAFYYFTGAHSLEQLMADALHFAHGLGYDVFNCLDVADNAEFLQNLRFGPGDGFLHYYLYNWRCPPMDPSSVGIVLQ